MADSGAVEKLKVFISYSRKDSPAFADELVLGLEDRGFAPFLDRHDIKPGELWTRLGALIEQSDTVVFVISPGSVNSERCVWEVNKALGLSKRLAGGLKSVEEKQIPAKLSDLQFVRFDTALGIMRPLRELAEALRVDLEWIREHTRLGELAQRCNRATAQDLLLRGDDLVAAKAWSVKRKPDAPEITELQRTFFQASEQAETARAAEFKSSATRDVHKFFEKGERRLLRNFRGDNVVLERDVGGQLCARARRRRQIRGRGRSEPDRSSERGQACPCYRGVEDHRPARGS